MNKYYVRSGTVKIILMAEDEIRACIDCVRKITSLEAVLGGIFTVSEKGFEEHEEDYKIALETVLNILKDHQRGLI